MSPTIKINSKIVNSIDLQQIRKMGKKTLNRFSTNKKSSKSQKRAKSSKRETQNAQKVEKRKRKKKTENFSLGGFFDAFNFNNNNNHKISKKRKSKSTKKATRKPKKRYSNKICEEKKQKKRKRQDQVKAEKEMVISLKTAIEGPGQVEVVKRQKRAEKRRKKNKKFLRKQAVTKIRKLARERNSKAQSGTLSSSSVVQKLKNQLKKKKFNFQQKSRKYKKFIIDQEDQDARPYKFKTSIAKLIHDRKNDDFQVFSSSEFSSYSDYPDKFSQNNCLSTESLSSVGSGNQKSSKNRKGVKMSAVKQNDLFSVSGDLKRKRLWNERRIITHIYEEKFQLPQSLDSLVKKFKSFEFEIEGLFKKQRRITFRKLREKVIFNHKK